jgi:hypothetical protein
MVVKFSSFAEKKNVGVTALWMTMVCLGSARQLCFAFNNPTTATLALASANKLATRTGISKLAVSPRVTSVSRPQLSQFSSRSWTTLSVAQSPQRHCYAATNSRVDQQTRLFAGNANDNDNDEETQTTTIRVPPITVPVNGSTSGALSADVATLAHSNNSMLKAVGLDGKLSDTTLTIPQRVVSTSDVFCNREMKIDQIKAIGFDMDYTLAQYKQPEFDRLAFDGAKAKLVESKGYPPEVLDFTFDHTQWVRGLIVDTQRGNFLKIDRHKYVRVAYHGFQPIASTIRKQLYSRTFNKIPSFSEKHFVNLDTLFQHVDAHLYASLVDLKDSDSSSSEFLDGKTYQELYKDVRACVDLCHRDGTYVLNMM